MSDGCFAYRVFISDSTLVLILKREIERGDKC
jgi:hypothetical protein